MSDEDGLKTLDSVYRLDAGLPSQEQLSYYRPGHFAYSRRRVMRVVLGGMSRAAGLLARALTTSSDEGNSYRFYSDIFRDLGCAVDCLRIAYRAHNAELTDEEFVDCLRTAYLRELKAEGEPPVCIVRHQLQGLQSLMFEAGGLFEDDGFSAEVRRKRACRMKHLIISILRLMVAMKRDIPELSKREGNHD